MGVKPSSNERPDLSFNFTATSNSIRCVFKRMGSLLSEKKNWGTLNSFGKDGLYILELKAVKYNFDFHSHVSKGEINSYSNEQHSCQLPFLI